MRRKIVWLLILALPFSILSLSTFANSGNGFKVEKGIRVSNGANSNTIKLDNSSYRMYYTANGIMAADSNDGINFTNNRQVLILQEVQAVFSNVTQISNSAIIKLNNGGWRMVFVGKSSTGRRLYSATSADGLTNWTVESGPFEEGEGGRIYTSAPDIIRLSDGRLRMYYCTGTKIKSAVSSDEGLNWTKEGSIKLNKKFKVALDLDITRVGKKYVLLFAVMPTGSSMSESKDKNKNKSKGKSNFKEIHSADSTDGRKFKYRGVTIKLDNFCAMDPDMISRGSGKYRIYFSRSTRESQIADILSAKSTKL